MHGHSSSALAGVLCALLFLGSGCERRQSLLDPTQGGSTAAASPVLPKDSVLRSGMVVRIGVRGSREGVPARVSVLLMDSTRRVAWRSDAIESDSGAAHVPLGSLPAEMVGQRWLFSAAVERQGTRTYAGSDTAGVTTLALAAVRQTQLVAGESRDVGGVVRALAASARRGELYFVTAEGGEVGVLDLKSGLLSDAIVRHPSGIGELDVAGNTLAYLADAGSRVGFVRLSDAALQHAPVLGPLEVLVTRERLEADGDVRIDSLGDMVRPYATRLQLACIDSEDTCEAPVALLASPTLSGGSVLRLASPRRDVAALVVADFTRLPVSTDSIPSTVRVFGRARPDGEVEMVLERSGAAGCASLHFGVRGFGVTAAGTVFSAGGDACGPGARLARIDGVLAGHPQLSRLAGATTAAEDRVRSAVEVLPAPDGSRVLVRETDEIWLLDRDLRVLGVRSVAPGARAAWRAPATGSGPVLRFAITDGETLEIFEGDSFRSTRSIPVGALAAAPLSYVRLGEGRDVVVFVPADRPSTVVTVEMDPR